MTPDDRKTKAVAKRIDSTYHKKPSPLRSLRRVLVVLCGVAAAAWGGWALFAKSERLYNPGPVTAAHAMFENDCSACHDGNGFRKSVSDNACLKCHDGAIHADKQTTLVSLDAGAPKTSSNCVTCHVEHKGHAALAGASDLLCTKCHDNLTANVAGGATLLQAAITKFDAPPAHPPFGRALPKKDGKPHDPTPLKFNHATHFEKTTARDCATCHQTDRTGDRRIMMPVSYEAHCRECHPMSLGGGMPDIPHESMDVVRQYAGSVMNDLAQKLLTASPEEREKILTIETKKKVGLKVTTVITKVTEAEWFDAQLKQITKPAEGNAALEALKSVEPAKRGVATLELYIGSLMQQGCVYCHEVKGAPTGVAASPADLLHTLPTGYAPAIRPMPATAPAASTRPIATPQGRRWFTASVFDHDAHRQMTCLECHAQAVTSALTSDVLMPDAQSCVKCHHPGGPNAKAASNNCVTCHVYHDRTRERSPVSGMTKK